MGLFTHGKATLRSKIIFLCTPDVAMPCPCGAWQGCAMPPHLRTVGSFRARTLVLPCFPTPTSQTTPCLLTVNIPLLHCLATMIPAPEIIHTSGFSRGRDYLCQLSLFHRTSDSRPTFHPLPTCFPSLSLLACHHSPDALSIPLSFPHRPSPPHSKLPSMACVLKRFPLTSPRK